MEYVEPEHAENLPGLRLALTAGMPAPYSMSARGILDIKGVRYTPVAQVGAGANETLVMWTKHRNAPIALYEDEAPRAGWLEILLLAERLGSGDSLLPADQGLRMQMIGWIHELIGEGGWVWHMRILMLGLGGPEHAAAASSKNPMFKQYGYSEEEQAKARLSAIRCMEGFSAFAKAQLASSAYLIGDKLSALDIYWLYFSQIMQTLSEDACPMPGMLRKSYDLASAACGVVIPELIEQRDWVLANHPRLPMSF